MIVGKPTLVETDAGDMEVALELENIVNVDMET